MSNSSVMSDFLNFTLKIAAPCNLNCSYCYVYNKADTTWKNRPALMSEDVFDCTIAKIKQHCIHSRQGTVEITFHGGEPCLIGPKRFSRWCVRARDVLSGVADINFCIQTNATLLNDEWAEVFYKNCVEVGVSLDGPAWLHDIHRVDKKGRGSHSKTKRGIEILQNSGINVGALTVVQLGQDGVDVHKHLLEYNFKSISYLLPHYSHDEMPGIWKAYGNTPCADFLLPILDDWWDNGAIDQEIVLFTQMSRVVLGGKSRVDLFGNSQLPFVFVETDGSIGGLDTLKVGEHRLAETGLNVASHQFVDIRYASELHRDVIFDGMPLPQECGDCPEVMTCGGGHLADRYSSLNLFNNRSIWCRDLLALFTRVRQLLDVNSKETLLRQRLLEEN